MYNCWELGVATPQFDTVIKVADLLQVSLDELAGRAKPSTELKIHNYELYSLYQQVDKLADKDQKALILVTDSFVKKGQMARVMAKTVKILP